MISYNDERYYYLGRFINYDEYDAGDAASSKNAKEN